MVSETVLGVEGIHTYYGAIEALKGISLEVRGGEIVTLIGSNGAGKTTTLRSINGLNHPRRGKIVFQGNDITKTPAHEVVKRGISQSPEGRKLFSRMSVVENLEMGAFQRTDRANFKEDMDRVLRTWTASSRSSRGLRNDGRRRRVRSRVGSNRCAPSGAP